MSEFLSKEGAKHITDTLIDKIDNVLPEVNLAIYKDGKELQTFFPLSPASYPIDGLKVKVRNEKSLEILKNIKYGLVRVKITNNVCLTSHIGWVTTDGTSRILTIGLDGYPIGFSYNEDYISLDSLYNLNWVSIQPYTLYQLSKYSDRLFNLVDNPEKEVVSILCDLYSMNSSGKPDTTSTRPTAIVDTDKMFSSGWPKYCTIKFNKDGWTKLENFFKNNPSEHTLVLNMVAGEGNQLLPVSFFKEKGAEKYMICGNYLNVYMRASRAIDVNNMAGTSEDNMFLELQVQDVRKDTGISNGQPSESQDSQDVIFKNNDGDITFNGNQIRIRPINGSRYYSTLTTAASDNTYYNLWLFYGDWTNMKQVELYISYSPSLVTALPMKFNTSSLATVTTGVGALQNPTIRVSGDFPTTIERGNILYLKILKLTDTAWIIEGEKI